MFLGAADPTVSGPCRPWCTVPDPADPQPGDVAWCCNDVDLSDSQQRAKAVWAAEWTSGVLWALTGFQYNGVCTADEYLCVRREPCGCGVLSGARWWRSRPEPAGDGVSFVNRCGCGPGCDCVARRRLRLPYQPVSAVTSVTVDGVALVQGTDWELVDGRYLQFCGTDSTWRACFDACADPVRGLRVGWSHGVDPPAELVNAACLFACEVTKGCLGQSCQLPRRIRTMTRQGVSWEMVDPQVLLAGGGVGIYEVDLALAVHGGPRTTVSFADDQPQGARW